MTHPLKQWREANRYTRRAFVDLLWRESNIKVTETDVQRWESGTLPRKHKRLAVEQVTGGQVTSASFL